MKGELEARNYKVSVYNGQSATPPVEASGGACVVVSRLSSYIQNNQEDLLTLSKLCHGHSRPLVLVALDTVAAKRLRRIPVSELRSNRTLLWDTKSFWAGWESVFPPPASPMPPASSPKTLMAVKKDEDVWTYLKQPPSQTLMPGGGGGPGSGDSSLSTQSTDDALTVSTARRFSTQRMSSQPRPYPSPLTSTLQYGDRGRSQPRRPHVIENPLMSHHRSKGHMQPQNPPVSLRQPMMLDEDEDEPIYHSLDDEAVEQPPDGDVTVYINADLEVVYPTLAEVAAASSRIRALDETEAEEAELSGLLLSDAYENEDLPLDYVPSPAPGSYPRHHLSYTASSPPVSTAASMASTAKSSKRPLPSGGLHFPPSQVVSTGRSGGYLV